MECQPPIFRMSATRPAISHGFLTERCSSSDVCSTLMPKFVVLCASNLNRATHHDPVRNIFCSAARQHVVTMVALHPQHRAHRRRASLLRTRPVEDVRFPAASTASRTVLVILVLWRNRIRRWRTLVIGLFSRASAFIMSGEMAFAYSSATRRTASFLFSTAATRRSSIASFSCTSHSPAAGPGASMRNYGGHRQRVVLRCWALAEKARWLSPLWVISGHSAVQLSCPLYPQKRTLVSATRMSALCQ